MSASARIISKVLMGGAAVLYVCVSAPPPSAAETPNQEATAIYLTDMSRCQPQAALSPKAKQGCWQLIPYETVESVPQRRHDDRRGVVRRCARRDAPAGRQGLACGLRGLLEPLHEL